MLEWKWALSRNITLRFLESHRDVSTVEGAITSHWASLGVIGTLFLSATSGNAGNSHILPLADEFPFTVSLYITFEMLGAASYATAVFLCIVHKTATAGQKGRALTCYVLSMPRCIGGPFLLNFAGWVFGDIGDSVGFYLTQNAPRAMVSLAFQIACWIAVFYSAMCAFVSREASTDLNLLEKEWVSAHGATTYDSDSDAEDDDWEFVTSALVKEIREMDAENEQQSKLKEASRLYLKARRNDCLDKLANTGDSQNDESVLEALKAFNTVKKLVQ